jgi:hypothetical protein
MPKIDFKRELRHLYQPSARDFTVVEVPPMNFLMIDGHGDPNKVTEYQQAVEGLYGVSYRIKFMSKMDLDKDYVVPPLEGLWWAADMAAFTDSRNKEAWDWTMMIMQPSWIGQEMVEEAVAQVAKKGDQPAIGKLRIQDYAEGLSVQILHIGSYEEEGPTLHRMHSVFIPQNGYEMSGKHHEIYLSDPRRTAPEKLKTVLRQPVRKIGQERIDL